MKIDFFEHNIETQLALTLQTGNVIIFDKLSSYKSPKSAVATQAEGTRNLFPPPYRTDVNPLEIAFAKLKTLILRAAVRTYDDLWRHDIQGCDLFIDKQCYNFFKAAGY